jgi:hypothetical protein
MTNASDWKDYMLLLMVNEKGTFSWLAKLNF